MRTHLRGAVLIAVLLIGLVTPAAAQYTPDQLRALQPVVLSVGEATRTAYPAAWRAAHAAGEPAGSEFVRRWALTLKTQGYKVCVNGKRGSDTLSQDVLVFPVTEGGNRDTSGQYAQIAIVDVIAGAGGPTPSLGWGDVSAASQGKCITPYLEPGEGGTTTPVDPPVTPGPDLSAIKAQLAQLVAQVAALTSQVAVLQAGQDAGRRELALHDATLGRLIDQQTRRIFGVLIEADGTTPKGVAEETVDHIWERQPRLRVRAW